jgi:tetratricopeptide (TPR) repeat protein
MRVLSNKQWILVAGALILGTVVYFSPRKAAVEKRVENNSAESFREEYLNKINKNLSEEDQKKAGKLLSDLKSSRGDQKIQVLDSLGNFYDNQKQPGLSAKYFEEIAKEQNTEKSWINAAFRYFDGFKSTKDSSIRPILVQKAIDCYSKALELNPSNLNVKTDLGVCYTETSQPMKGILLLKEVTTENPKHENAQMNLGLLSMKSGQYDKAIERFLKVIEINPSRSEIYLYLGQSYLQKDNKKEAIEYFEKYTGESKDPIMTSQVQEYIKELKRN